jgi:hypothetical protein
MHVLSLVTCSVVIIASVAAICFFAVELIRSITHYPDAEFQNQDFPPRNNYTDVTADDLKMLAEPRKQSVAYFHVCMSGSWKDSVSFILSEFKKNNGNLLFDAVHVVALGTHENLDHLKEILSSNPLFVIRKHLEDMTCYERITLNMIWDDSDKTQADFNIFYFHSKGISNKVGTPRHKNVQDWIKFMLRMCIDPLAPKLLEIIDTCGANVDDSPKQHFSGNFWWATSGYIASLQRNIGQGYLDPEFWICTRSPLLVCLGKGLSPGARHYLEPYPEITAPNREIFVNDIKVFREYVPSEHVDVR